MSTSNKINSSPGKLNRSFKFFQAYGLDLIIGIVMASFFVLMMSFTSQAQNVGINNPTPHTKSLLDLTSGDKGLLAPRMTQVQRTAMFPAADATAKGMLVYQTDNTQGFYYYDGTIWQFIANGNAGWGLTGNAGTAAATNFIGTTDNNDMVLKTNNTEIGRFTTNKKFLMGATSFSNPYSKIEIADEDGSNSDISIRVASTGWGDFAFCKSRGTIAAPLATAAGDVNGALSAWSHDGTKYMLSSRIAFLNDSNATLNDVAGSIRFYIANNNATPEAMRISSNGFVGIGNGAPLYPLSFGNTIGDKISFWGGAGPHYGIGIQGSLLQIHAGGIGDDIAFGYGSSAAFTERMRIKGNGNVGIGNINPLQKLDVTGNINVVADSNYRINNVRVLAIKGTNNLFAGASAGINNSSGGYNTFAGNGSGYNNTTGGSNAFFGQATGLNNTTGTFNSFLGNCAGVGNLTGAANVYVGSHSGFNATAGNQNVFIGASSGYNNTVDYSLFIGPYAGFSNTTGPSNTFIGTSCGYSNQVGANNTFVGFMSGWNNNASNNTFMGWQAGQSTTTGLGNAFFGSNTGYQNTTGQGNAFFGHYAGGSSSTGNNNMCMGFFSLGQNISGSNNIALGYNAGYANTTGSANIFIGINADASANNLINAAAIGAGAIVSANNSMVLGNNQNVGIGTSAPAAKLDVVGSVKITNGTQAAGRVLTSDATGNATWQTITPASANAWGMIGNSGTNSSTNFIGTTDANALAIRTNNVERMQISSAGNVGINAVPNPNYILTVESTGSSIYGSTSSLSGSNAGVTGWSTSAIGSGRGVLGSSAGDNGSGVYGWASSATGVTVGVYGGSISTAGYGIQGIGSALSGTNYGVYGAAYSPNGYNGYFTGPGRFASMSNSGFQTNNPQTTVDINGGLTIRDSSLLASTASFTITVGNRSYIRVNSNATPASRLIGLSNGLQIGQVLILECTATGGVNGIRMSDTPATYNTNLITFHDMYENDVITLLWNGTDWLEVSYANN